MFSLTKFVLALGWSGFLMVGADFFTSFFSTGSVDDLTFAALVSFLAGFLTRLSVGSLIFIELLELRAAALEGLSDPGRMLDRLPCSSVCMFEEYADLNWVGVQAAGSVSPRVASMN